jgi:hypothetical protein
MSDIIIISHWLENKSKKIIDEINYLIDIYNADSSNDNQQEFKLIDYKIDVLYNTLNKFEDKLKRILTKV